MRFYKHLPPKKIFIPSLVPIEKAVTTIFKYLPARYPLESLLIYGRNQSGCEKAKNLVFLPFILWVFLTIYIFVALMKITMCFKQLGASHNMSWDS